MSRIDKLTEATLTAIIEFVDNLILFEPNFLPLKLYSATCKRCLTEGTTEPPPPKKGEKPKPKILIKKIIDPFRDLVDTHLAFLDSIGTLRILPADYELSYTPGKIFIPLGKIMRRVGPDDREAFRHHLLSIGMLVAGPNTNKAKLAELLDFFTPLVAEDGDEELELTDMDKQFLGPIAAAIPGVDLKMLHKLGMKNLGNINPEGMTTEDMTDKVIDGIAGVLRQGFFQNIVGAMTVKAENGEMAQMDPSKMMEMLAVSQNLMTQAMAQQAAGGGGGQPQ